MIANADRPRLVLLAIDASSASCIERWIQDGSMPRLAALRKRGLHGAVDSTAEYLAGTPWPTFLTGSLPPEHGWMFYSHWRPDVMRYLRPTQAWRPIEPFYRTWPLDGPRVIAVDVPLAYPPRPFNGVELVGWGTHDKLCPPLTFPAGLADRIKLEIGPRPLTDEISGHQPARELLKLRDEMKRAADWHAEVGLRLMRDEAWDLFVLGFGNVHRTGHKIWDHTSADGPVTDAERAALDDAMRQVAIATDRAIGRLLDAVDADIPVIVFSLHGMMENYSVFPVLPRILERIVNDERRDDPAEPPARRLLSQLRDMIPLSVRSRMKSALPIPAQDWLSVFWHTKRHDWSRTKAFCLSGDLEGLIQVNLKGRERDGIVAPGAEYEALLAKIIEGFESFTDIETGDPLVLDISRGDTIWPESTRRNYLPDLIVRTTKRGARNIPGFKSERYGTVVNYDRGKHVDGRSGHHTGEGWFIAAGEGFTGRGAHPKVHELDLTATVHALLGMPYPAPMRGRPIAAMCGGAAEPAG